MKNLEFIHIPKTAGTTIEDLGRKNNISWGRFNKNYNATEFANCSLWHNPTRKYNTPTFCVVRDPVDRMVSEYKYWAKRNRKNHICSPDHMNRWLQNKIQKSDSDPDTENCHFRKQTNFTKNCNHTLNFENLSESFDELMQEYSMNMRLDDIRPSQVASENCNVGITDLDDITTELILRKYEEDIELFKSLEN